MVKYRIKLILTLLILIGILSCGRITQKVEEKVNEKIDKAIDENLNKLDSSLNKNTIDSLKKYMKGIDSTIKTETEKKKK